jgi:PadR family transcriptional regulator, regulatory protein AphA
VSLDHAILGFLSERPGSGYDLKTRCFEGASSQFWGADQAQIYRTLERLQKARLVTSTRKKQSGRPDRKVFEITHSGREALGAWLASGLPLPASRDPFYLQLYFGAELSDEALDSVLTGRRAEHQCRLETLRATSAAVAADREGSERVTTLRLTAFDGAMARERAAIDWLDDCIHAVREGALAGSHDEGIGQRHLFGG